MEPKEQFLTAAQRVAPVSPVCSTEQMAEMMGELFVTLTDLTEAPMKQGYATRSQLSEYFGYESRKGFSPALDVLLHRYSKRIRRFKPESQSSKGGWTQGVTRFNIEDVEKLLLEHHSAKAN